MKQVVLGILVFLPFFGFTQRLVLETKVESSDGFTNLKEAYSIVNKEDSSFSVFLLDKENIKGLLFDKKLNVIGELSTKRLEGYPDIVGYSIVRKNYNIFFSSKKREEFALTSFDYSKAHVFKAEKWLRLNKEIYLGSTQYRDKYYLLTCVKSSILRLYVFEEHVPFTTKDFDLSNIKFSNDNFPELGYVFDVNKPAQIDNQVPNALSTTFNKTKIYYDQDKILITLDNQTTKTILITINLSELKADVSYYKFDRLECGTVGSTTSNSFIHENRLYQFKACLGAMSFLVTDLVTSRLAKQYVATKEDELFIKNSEFFKTKKFLKEISQSTAAISAYRTTDGIQLILGSYHYDPYPSTSASTPEHLVFHQSTPPPANSYSSFFSPNGYRCLLDSITYEKKVGIIRHNAFVKIKMFTDTMTKKPVAETVFKWQDKYLFFYYLKSESTYSIREFAD